MSGNGNAYIENLQLTQPFIQTGFGDHFNFAASQQGRVCGFFEAQFFKCMEAYGQKLSRLYCDLENRDYYECLTHEKMRKRYEAMRMERYKQWLDGRRDTPFEKDHLKIGQYTPDYYSHVRANIY